MQHISILQQIKLFLSKFINFGFVPKKWKNININFLEQRIKDLEDYSYKNGEIDLHDYFYSLRCGIFDESDCITCKKVSDLMYKHNLSFYDDEFNYEQFIELYKNYK